MSYKCSNCGDSFSSNDKRVEHVRKEHPRLTAEGIPRKNDGRVGRVPGNKKCGNCSHPMGRHEMKQVRGQYITYCPDCGGPCSKVR